LQFPIFDQYHFKLGVSFVYSTVKDDRFQITNVTAGDVTQLFVDQVRQRSYSVLATANLTIFPFRKSEFPWQARFAGEARPSFVEDVGLMLGFGIPSPNKDFFLGLSWFPTGTPVGIQAAWHLALRDYPPADVTLGQPVTSRNFVLRQKSARGLAAGFVFTTDFFGKVVGPIFKT
ncbi:MAG: hypothetical protein ACREBE_21880, partial [bacterium]